MATVKFSETVVFEVMQCVNARCGMQIGLPEQYVSRLRRDSGTFYCPACGTSQGWTKSESDKVRDEANKLRGDLANARAAQVRAEEGQRRATQDAQYFKDSRNAYKGQVTKLKNRAANGVCPCCNRHFENLHRHMATKHPDFAKEEVPNGGS